MDGKFGETGVAPRSKKKKGEKSPPFLGSKTFIGIIDISTAKKQRLIVTNEKKRSSKVRIAGRGGGKKMQHV